MKHSVFRVAVVILAFCAHARAQCPEGFTLKEGINTSYFENADARNVIAHCVECISKNKKQAISFQSTDELWMRETTCHQKLLECRAEPKEFVDEEENKDVVSWDLTCLAACCYLQAAFFICCRLLARREETVTTITGKNVPC